MVIQFKSSGFIEKEYKSKISIIHFDMHRIIVHELANPEDNYYTIMNSTRSSFGFHNLTLTFTFESNNITWFNNGLYIKKLNKW